jgi:DnaK suppressor protein
MDHLSRDQQDELRAELERQLRRLEKSMKLSEEASRTVELDQAAVGRLSRMDSLQSQSMARSLAERERVRRTLILEALQRVEAGTYGACAECGTGIAYGRLLLLPEASHCGGCG